MSGTAWDFDAPQCGTCQHHDVLGRGLTALAHQDGTCTVTGTEHVGADACDCAAFAPDTRDLTERHGALTGEVFAYLKRHDTAGRLKDAAAAALRGERPAVNVGGLLWVPSYSGPKPASSDYPTDPKEAA